MLRVSEIEIAKLVEEQRILMRLQKTGLGYAKVQSLCLRKLNAINTVKHLAVVLDTE